MIAEPLSPAWTHALHCADVVRRLQHHVQPAALRQAAGAKVPDSWPHKALEGAASGCDVLHTAAPWVAHAAVLGAKFAGVHTGPLGKLAAVFPMAQLATGDGVNRGTETAPAGTFARLRTTGIIDAPEKACLKAAQSPNLADKPISRTALLGAAVGLRALGQIPRLLVGFVSALAALVGAVIGVLTHFITRAYRALARAPAQVADIISRLQAHVAVWEHNLASGTALVHKAQALAARAQQIWQRVSAPLQSVGRWAQNMGAMRPASALHSVGSSAPIASGIDAEVAAQDLGTRALPEFSAASAVACLQSVAAGAERIHQGADAVARVMGRVKAAMLSVSVVCAQVQRAQLLTSAWSYVDAVRAQLPGLPLSWPAALQLRLTST